MKLTNRRNFLKLLLISSSLLVLGRLSISEMQHAQNGLTPFGSWYVVQYSQIVPDILLNNYVLTVDGDVENPVQLTYQNLLTMPSIEVKDTIQCVSDPYFLRANVVWKGVPLSNIIEIVKPKPSVIKVVGYGADGYTADLPIEKANDPNVLVTYMADGKPLPQVHGYPVRLSVPGWWGYTYIKWLVRLHFTSKNILGYWESLGYPDYAKK
ncbi:oxidoreductase molybdopterin binding [Sulfolobus islandicus M.14.25]|uniref:Oxidoreductase molybdopterin binding n=1 Tax=Saccharolobus islandicus (strain M.14.25 / Kamchatka \|nr:molybdopterin-dependent oxidoreductase [Sulfolobus islandicus]ACP39196.1 oxidoreductase molybdopterin binding [Sulfolobus islandicus M.14.25]